jgi:6-phosphogluconolactonase
MDKLTRRSFLKTATAATLASAVSPSLLASPVRHRVFVGCKASDGILAFDWDPSTAELTPAGVAAKFAGVQWITLSADHKYLFAAAGLNEFNGKPTGAVASFRVANGELEELSAQNSAGMGTCHVALDPTGNVLIAADYYGGSAASFRVTDGKLSPATWTEHYTGHGPNADRQQSAHAHFVSYSPDNRFAYINDLGLDCIHIYRMYFRSADWKNHDLNSDSPLLNTNMPVPGNFPTLLNEGSYKARPGSGPRTLHFHPNGHTAYSVNELVSTVDVLEWSQATGGLTLVSRVELLPEGYHGPTRGCDTEITRDGKFVYFANRDNNFLYSFRAEFASGKLTPIGRSNCGGKTPRSITLDPTERWMLVANQDSNLVSVFRRNRETGALAEEGKSFAAATPMRILFA